MQNHRYLTRYNGQKGARNSFCGWRLCITRQKEVYVRYFTDREHGGMEQAQEAALKIRDAMLAEMTAGCNFAELCRRYAKTRYKA